MRLALSVLLVLPACSGGMVAAVYPGERVTVGGEVFVVEETTRSGARLRNFATGIGNQDRLRGLARVAAAQATGCTATGVSQSPGVNLYDVDLSC